MSLIIRSSEIRKFKRCRRSWYLGYERQMSLAPSPDRPASGKRDLGTLVHKGLEGYYWDGTHPVDTVDALRAAATPPEGMSPEWSDTYSLASLMVGGYVDWVEQEGADAGERTLGVELRCTVPLGNILGEDVWFTFQIDRLVLNEQFGYVTIEDHKTVDNLSKDVQFQVDDQLLMYDVGLRIAGFPAGLIRGGRHNMLRKVKRTARAKPPFYGRVAVDFNEQQVDAAWQHLSGTVADMVQVIQSVRRTGGDAHHVRCYPNPTKDCSWDCDFVQVCTMLDDGSDWEGMLSSPVFIKRENRQDNG